MGERQKHFPFPERRENISDKLQRVAPQNTPESELSRLSGIYEAKASAFREVLYEAGRRRPTVRHVISEVKRLEREAEYVKAVLAVKSKQNKSE
jgi:hypothetical protein